MAIQLTEVLLDRYLAGECSPEEADAVAIGLAGAPVSAYAIDWLKGQFKATDAPVTEHSWAKLSNRLDSDDRQAADAGWLAYPARWARSIIAAGALAGAAGVLALGVASIWTHARATGTDLRQGSLIGVVANDIPTRPLVDMAIRPGSEDLLDAVLH